MFESHVFKQITHIFFCHMVLLSVVEPEGSSLIIHSSGECCNHPSALFQKVTLLFQVKVCPLTWSSDVSVTNKCGAFLLLWVSLCSEEVPFQVSVSCFQSDLSLMCPQASSSSVSRWRFVIISLTFFCTEMPMSWITSIFRVFTTRDSLETRPVWPFIIED